MPVNIANILRQRTLASLAKSLFAVKNEPEMQKRVEEALVAANPHLADEGGLVAGDTVVVPQVAGVATTDAVRRANLIGPEPRSASGRRLAGLLAVTARLAGRAQEEAKAMSLQLEAREFVARLSHAHPELKTQLPHIAKAVAAHSDHVILRAKQLEEAIKMIQLDQDRQGRLSQ